MMKKLALAFVAMAILFGCKDNPVSQKIQETKQQVSNTNKAVKEINEMQDDIEKLQEMEPLTNAELKAWLPKEVNGMKRISFKAGDMGMMQISSIQATYANEDKSKKFKIEVIDGAGAIGASATTALRFMFSQDFEEETEHKTRRTTTKNGMKAIEEYQKKNNRSSIEFMDDDRFYFKATGTNMDLEETWDAIEEINPEDLG